MDEYSTANLTKVAAFKGVPFSSIDWFWANSELKHFTEGEAVFSAGSPIVHTMVILEGEVLIYRVSAEKQSESVRIGAGSITGFLPFSRVTNSIGSGMATVASSVLFFPKEKTKELIHDHYELAEALVHEMSTRIKEFTSQQLLNEKMIALGKLSAGLAHELNNPAAAIARSSSSLLERLRKLPEEFKGILGLCLDPNVIEQLTGLLARKLEFDSPVTLSPLKRSQREDELTDRLELLGVENADIVADNLIEFSYTDSELIELESLLEGASNSVIYNWFSDVLASERIVRDINESGKRISELVKSVKVFTHMDQSNEMRKANIHEGIRNTLTMLNYRFKKGNIKLVGEFDEALPHATLQVGEFNQVWTNLIDNALDAMEAQQAGVLTISTGSDGSSIIINICDTGSGLPENIQNKIFEPFFTTKDIGKGTGLGLELAYGIVRRHKGSLTFNSQPGNTCFVVTLPLS